MLDRAIDFGHRCGKDIAVHFAIRPSLSKRSETAVVLLAAIVFLIGHSSPALAQSGLQGWWRLMALMKELAPPVKDSVRE